MKHPISIETAEKTARKLGQFSDVSIDRRKLLKTIVASAPESLQRNAQLNAYFAVDTSELVRLRAGWISGARAYVGLGVIALVLLGSGVLWFNFSNTGQTPSQFSAEQVQANGKLSNAVNAITQQSSSEVTTALSGETDQNSISVASSQLQQMQDSIDEKF